MNQKKAVVIEVVVIVVLALFMLLNFSKKNKISNQSIPTKTIPTNILSNTQPITSFSGKVEKIEGNTVSIFDEYNLPQSTIPTPPITYRVLVTDNTQINKRATFINYLFKTITPAPQIKLTIKDIKIGQVVTVSSPVDLRTLKNNEFEATVIELPRISNMLIGNVVNIVGNTLTVEAFTPANDSIPENTATVSPQKREFTITITQDTEVSRMNYQGKPEMLAISDLKKDIRVIVYTAEDVTKSQTLTALHIELALKTPSISSVSPSIKP